MAHDVVMVSSLTCSLEPEKTSQLGNGPIIFQCSLSGQAKQGQPANNSLGYDWLCLLRAGLPHVRRQARKQWEPIKRLYSNACEGAKSVHPRVNGVAKINTKPFHNIHAKHWDVLSLRHSGLKQCEMENCSALLVRRNPNWTNTDVGQCRSPSDSNASAQWT